MYFSGRAKGDTSGGTKLGLDFQDIRATGEWVLLVREATLRRYENNTGKKNTTVNKGGKEENIKPWKPGERDSIDADGNELPLNSRAQEYDKESCDYDLTHRRMQWLQGRQNQGEA